MKKFWLMLPVLFALALNATHVDAKKFGGGKSFGKLFQTKPSPAKKAAPNNSGAAKQKAPAKGGMAKGLMGGLLAGGLIAALMGGAFEGIQIMDIILLALVAFILIRLFKGMMQAKAASMEPQPAYSTNQFRQESQTDAQPSKFLAGQFPQSSSGNQPTANQNNDATFNEEQTSGFGSYNDVPYNLPADFDINNFLTGAREHYRTIQLAWNENDLGKIEEYVSSELFSHLKEERAALEGEQHTNVLFIDAQIVRADQSAGLAELSIQFSGRYSDETEGVEEDITDLWHLTRDTRDNNAPWLIVGIEN
ncbi:hypothetical protein A3743_06110 [Oleiphilus sp. HI0072]|uniref:Tim44 domain-containing protein n=1 Tax=Oleiphilus sp. HI0132 TaxID=1822270 RepID=UPI0007C3FB69|nr:TIM44-like domain-containing protein [Oleiphilus sp. HI0132]KZY93663.1 hypothetical protein A3743_06110 [Oleiphilus sp. HI0072]KZZ71668.1 hypothetical protein A3766_08085 [Oleiphilus sp. HI0132]